MLHVAHVGVRRVHNGHQDVVESVLVVLHTFA